MDGGNEMRIWKYKNILKKEIMLKFDDDQQAFYLDVNEETFCFSVYHNQLEVRLIESKGRIVSIRIIPQAANTILLGGFHE